MSLISKLRELTTDARSILSNEMYQNLKSHLEQDASKGRNFSYVTVGPALNNAYGPVFGCWEIHLDMLKKEGLKVDLQPDHKMSLNQNVFKISW